VEVLTETFIPDEPSKKWLGAVSTPRGGVGAISRPLPQCPACDSDRLISLVSDGEVNFSCIQCDRSWHVELGFVRRVHPPTSGFSPLPHGTSQTASTIVAESTPRD
jgi:hypothetical protein